MGAGDEERKDNRLGIRRGEEGREEMGGGDEERREKI